MLFSVFSFVSFEQLRSAMGTAISSAASGIWGGPMHESTAVVNTIGTIIPTIASPSFDAHATLGPLWSEVWDSYRVHDSSVLESSLRESSVWDSKWAHDPIFPWVEWTAVPETTAAETALRLGMFLTLLTLGAYFLLGLYNAVRMRRGILAWATLIIFFSLLLLVLRDDTVAILAAIVVCFIEWMCFRRRSKPLPRSQQPPDFRRKLLEARIQSDGDDASTGDRYPTKSSSGVAHGQSVDPEVKKSDSRPEQVPTSNPTEQLLAEKNALLAQQDEHIKVLEHECTEASTAMAELKRIVKSLEETAARKDERIKALEDALQAAKEKTEMHMISTARLAEAQRWQDFDRVELEKTLRLEKKAHEKKSRLLRAECEVSNIYKVDLASTRQQLCDTRAELGTQRYQTESAGEALSALQKRFDIVCSRRDALSHENDQLGAENVSLKKQNFRLSRTVEKQATEARDSSKDGKTLGSTDDQVRSEAVETKRRVADLQRENENLKASLSSAQNQNVSLATEIRRLQDASLRHTCPPCSCPPCSCRDGGCEVDAEQDCGDEDRDDGDHHHGQDDGDHPDDDDSDDDRPSQQLTSNFTHAELPTASPATSAAGQRSNEVTEGPTEELSSDVLSTPEAFDSIRLSDVISAPPETGDGDAKLDLHETLLTGRAVQDVSVPDPGCDAPTMGMRRDSRGDFVETAVASKQDATATYATEVGSGAQWMFREQAREVSHDDLVSEPDELPEDADSVSLPAAWNQPCMSPSAKNKTELALSALISSLEDLPATNAAMTARLEEPAHTTAVLGWDPEVDGGIPAVVEEAVRANDEMTDSDEVDNAIPVVAEEAVQTNDTRTGEAEVDTAMSDIAHEPLEGNDPMIRAADGDSLMATSAMDDATNHDSLGTDGQGVSEVQPSHESYGRVVFMTNPWASLLAETDAAIDTEMSSDTEQPAPQVPDSSTERRDEEMADVSRDMPDAHPQPHTFQLPENNNGVGIINFDEWLSNDDPSLGMPPLASQGRTSEPAAFEQPSDWSFMDRDWTYPEEFWEALSTTTQTKLNGAQVDGFLYTPREELQLIRQGQLNSEHSAFWCDRVLGNDLDVYLAIVDPQYFCLPNAPTQYTEPSSSEPSSSAAAVAPQYAQQQASSSSAVAVAPQYPQQQASSSLAAATAPQYPLQQAPSSPAVAMAPQYSPQQANVQGVACEDTASTPGTSRSKGKERMIWDNSSTPSPASQAPTAETSSIPVSTPDPPVASSSSAASRRPRWQPRPLSKSGVRRNPPPQSLVSPLSQVSNNNGPGTPDEAKERLRQALRPTARADASANLKTSFPQSMTVQSQSSQMRIFSGDSNGAGIDLPTWRPQPTSFSFGLPENIREMLDSLPSGSRDVGQWPAMFYDILEPGHSADRIAEMVRAEWTPAEELRHIWNNKWTEDNYHFWTRGFLGAADYAKIAH